MATRLYNELTDKEFFAVESIDTELPPDYVILYLRNKSEQDTRVVVSPLTIEQYELEQQNPSIKMKGNSANFCLSSYIPE